MPHDALHDSMVLVKNSMEARFFFVAYSLVGCSPLVVTVFVFFDASESATRALARSLPLGSYFAGTRKIKIKSDRER